MCPCPRSGEVMLAKKVFYLPTVPGVRTSQCQRHSEGVGRDANALENRLLLDFLIRKPPDFVWAFLATDRGQITDSSADMGCLVGLSLPPVLEITKK